ncbi:unnamed protein product [Closterium sp. NIES-53]
MWLSQTMPCNSPLFTPFPPNHPLLYPLPPRSTCVVGTWLSRTSQSLLPLPPSPVLLPLPSSSQPQHLRSWNVALAKDVMHLSSSPAFCHYPPALLSSFLFPPTQHLRSRNVALAKDAMQLAPQSPSSGAGASDQSQVATSADGAGSAPTHAELEAARRQLAEAEASVATLRGEQETLMGELMQVGFVYFKYTR